MSSKRKLTGIILSLILFGGVCFKIGTVYSNGGNPTIDPTSGEGLSGFSWYNASIGIYAPEFWHEDLGNYTAWIESIEGGGGVTDHGDLTGLGDDDHNLYLLQSGVEGLTGDWDVGNYDLTAKDITADEFYRTGIGNYTAWVESIASGGEGSGPITQIYTFTHILFYNDTASIYQLNNLDGGQSTGTLVSLLDSVPEYACVKINLDGTHTLTSTWDVKDHQSYLGNGIGTTVLQRNGNYVMISIDSGGTGNKEKVNIEGITLDGGGVSYTADLIYIRSLKDSYIKNIHLKEFKGNGIYVCGVSGYNTFWLHLENIQYENSNSIQHNGAVIYFDRWAIDSSIKNVWGGNGAGGVAADYDDSVLLWIDDATDIVVDRIWGVRHKNLIRFQSDVWVGGCFFNDIWPDTNVEDAIYFDLNGADMGGLTFTNIFVIPAFQAGFDVFYFDLPSGTFLSDVYVDNIHGTTTPCDYIYNKQGTGTLRRSMFENAFITTGSSGRYNNIDYSDIGYDRLWDDNKYQTQTDASWVDPTWFGTPDDGEKTTVYNSNLGEYRIYTYANSGWRYTSMTP